MAQKQPYFKIAAVVSAVLLVGAFVSYRAGAFERFLKPEPQPPTEPQAEPAGETPAGTDQKSQVFIYSSKSAPAFTPAPAPTTPVPEKPVFLGGSKSIVLTPTSGFPPGTASKPGAAPPSPNAPKP